MFIGEGPGAVEDECGLPFSGPAGQLLRSTVAEYSYDDSVYYCNIVKCRCPGNREPTDVEVAACRGFLAYQVELIKPDLIVTLGNPATRTVLNRKVGGITKIHGMLFKTEGGRSVVPVIHPAAPLHNPDLMSEYKSGFKRMMSYVHTLSGCPY
jgi:DNA polymerase